MTARERFREVMDFNREVRPPKWEYAFWGETLNRWYSQGLPRRSFVRCPQGITTPTGSLYYTAYNTQRETLRRGMLPPGQVVFAGGVYWPTQGVPKDRDVEEHFGFDEGIELLDINQLLCPMFEPEVIDDTKETLRYRDLDGIVRLYQKQESTMPTAVGWLVSDWRSWSALKEHRLRPRDLAGRFPPDWEGKVRDLHARSHPIALGGYPHGLFGTPSHIMGYENLFLAYYDSPELVHDILDTFAQLWMNLWEEVLGVMEVDMVHFFEDVSMGTGSMISPAVFREFMSPRYKRLCGFLKSRGVDVILVDTDGDCTELVPLFLEAGVTGLYPMETSTGMDIQRIRRDYPRLQMLGGVSKYAVAGGRDATEKALRTTEALLRHGGYIPYVDHSVPPSVSWSDFRYYRDRLNSILDEVDAR